MKGLLYQNLLNWKNKENRKPLILNGARQVERTWLILTVITFGIFSFWIPIKLKKWKTKHTSFIA